MSLVTQVSKQGSQYPRRKHRGQPIGQEEREASKRGSSLWLRSQQATPHPPGHPAMHPSALGRSTSQGSQTLMLLFNLLVERPGSAQLSGPRSLTNAFHEGRVKSVCEEGLGQLPEIELEGASDGIDVHVTQHQQDVLVICRRGARLGATSA